VVAGEKSHPQFGVDLTLSEPSSPAKLSLSVGDGSEQIQSGLLSYPIGFRSGPHDKFTAEGTLDFGFGVRFEQKESGWDINFQAAEVATVKFSKCSGVQADCDKLKLSLETEFKREVLLFLNPNIDFFDQPTASKLIGGML